MGCGHWLPGGGSGLLGVDGAGVNPGVKVGAAVLDVTPDPDEHRAGGM